MGSEETHYHKAVSLNKIGNFMKIFKRTKKRINGNASKKLTVKHVMIFRIIHKEIIEDCVFDDSLKIC